MTASTKNQLDERLKDVFGTNIAELAEKYEKSLGTAAALEHTDEINAMATAVAWGMVNAAPATMFLAAQLLFAIGYTAGKEALDLSIFEDALRDDSKVAE